jgi:hypothetical protein
MNPLTLPTVHLNGTSRDTLLEGYIAALDALRLATEALQASAPNARDYYVQAGDTFCMAQNQHFVRLARLRETLDEMNTLAEHVSTLV